MITILNGGETSIKHYPGADTLLNVQVVSDDGTAKAIVPGMTANALMHQGNRAAASVFPLTPDPVKNVVGYCSGRIPFHLSLPDLDQLYTLEVEVVSNDGVGAVSIVSRGSYTSPPAVAFTGVGAGATGYAVISGGVSSVVGTMMGTAVGVKAVSATAPQLSGRAAAITLTTKGGVQSVAVGSNTYMGIPVVTVGAPPSGVTATVRPVITQSVMQICYETAKVSYGSAGDYVEIYCSSTEGYGYAAVQLGAGGFIVGPINMSFNNYYYPGSPLPPPFVIYVNNYSMGTSVPAPNISVGSFDVWTIASVVVEAQGFGYLAAPTISVTGTPRTAAVFTLMMAPLAAEYVITDPGEGYLAPPTLSASATTGDLVASLVFGVTGVVVTATGAGYTVAPSVDFTPPGATALATTVRSSVEISTAFPLSLE